MAQIDGFPGPVSLVEGLPTPLSDSNSLQVSLAREPNGTDTDKSANDWALAGPTPGFANSPSISSGTGLHGTCGRTPPPPAFR
jgi:hypothetical protein